MTPKLVALGFEAKGAYGIEGRRYFRRTVEGQRRTHLHVYSAVDQPRLGRCWLFGTICEATRGRRAPTPGQKVMPSRRLSHINRPRTVLSRRLPNGPATGLRGGRLLPQSTTNPGCSVSISGATVTALAGMNGAAIRRTAMGGDPPGEARADTRTRTQRGRQPPRNVHG